MTSLTDGQGDQTAYAYDDDNRPTGVSYPNGGGEAYAYNPLGRVASATATGSGGSVLSGLTYSYGKNSNPTSLADQDGNESTFVYDALDALAQEVHPEKTLSYTYDVARNRASTTDGTTTTNYTYDASERMTAAGSESFSYDQNGNMTSRTSGSETTEYSYDVRDRLVQAGQKSYQRDTLGRVVSSADEGETQTDFLFDGARVIQEKTGSESVSYARGLFGRLISLRLGTSSPSYYHHDSVGSVVGLSDNAGALSDSYSYDAFGNELAKTGQGEQSYRYLGNRYEPSTGLYDSHARHYDPKSGRFLSKDPVRGRPSKPQGLNPYACSLNNPQRFPDPSGLVPAYDETQTMNGSEGEGEDFTGQEEGTTSPEEEASGQDCSQYIPESAQVPSEEDPYVPNPDREGPVQENIREAELASYGHYLPPPFNFAGDAYFGYNVHPSLGSFDPGASQDYKSYIEKDEEDPLYQSYAYYGNFNFGATGAALGYDERTLQDAGGADQQVFGPRDPDTFTPEEQERIDQGDIRAYDYPDDQDQIQQGYDYYNCLKESGF